MPNANTYLPPSPVTPGFLNVTNITQAAQAVVTIVNSNENTYIPGQVIYFSIPQTYGMTQINGLTGQILEIAGTNFTVDINTLSFNPFVIPATFQEKPATISPAGSRNLEFTNSTTKVPFQSLNNQGN